jgi:hypothetical protein
VTNIAPASGGNHTLTVQRAILSTSAAAHNNNRSVFVRHPFADTGGGGGGATYLDALLDVTLDGSVPVGEVLTHIGGGVWSNEPAPEGPEGPEGPQGIQGPIGLTGLTGPPGPQGEQGIDGAEGPEGPAGSPGATGPQGATGPEGPQGEVGPAGASDWDDITDKPATFPPSTHNHDDRYMTDAEVAAAIAAGGSGAPSWDDVTDKPTTFPPDTHNHDDRYYTEAEVTTLLAAKADAAAVYTQTIDAKTANYTLVATDVGKLITMTSASALSLSIPTDAAVTWPVGARVDVLVMGAGMVTVSAAFPGTTTVNGTPSLVSRAQWSAFSLIKRAANLWVVVGDLA